MCCVQEYIVNLSRIFQGLKLDRLLPYSVAGNLPVVDTKYRAASPLALLKLKFCRYRKEEWKSGQTLQTWSLAPVSTDITRSNGSHTWVSDTAEGWEIAGWSGFSLVSSMVVTSLLGRLRHLHTVEAFCQVSSDKMAPGLALHTAHRKREPSSFWCHAPYLVKSPKCKGWKF